MPANKCTECRRFNGCTKNSEEWEKAKSLHSVDVKHLINPNTRLSTEEKRAVSHMDSVARKCEEAVPV